MKRVGKRMWAYALFLAAASGSAQAALQDRGGGLIYDDVLDVTWLADANLAGSAMTWDGAMAWADGLVYHDSVRHVDYTDWRLPSALDSEMGHLYADLGGSFGYRVTASGDPDLALFQNIQDDPAWDEYYWTGTEYLYAGSLSAVYFAMSNGNEQNDFKTAFKYAWAVRTGDVAPIPEPESWALMLAGLGLVGGLARRRARIGA